MGLGAIAGSNNEHEMLHGITETGMGVGSRSSAFYPCMQLLFPMNDSSGMPAFWGGLREG